MDNSNVTQLHPKDKNQKEEASLVSSFALTFKSIKECFDNCSSM